MTDDIVTRLRRECQCTDDCRAVNDPCIFMRAADEIERLTKWRKNAFKALLALDKREAEIERLRATIGGWSQDISNLQDEVERLRGMCDMLANHLRSGSDSGWDDAIDKWEDTTGRTS